MFRAKTVERNSRKWPAITALVVEIEVFRNQTAPVSNDETLEIFLHGRGAAIKRPAARR